MAGVLVGLGPVRHLVSMREADRGTAQRAVGEMGIQRIVDALVLPVAPHLELVLDPGPVGQLEHDVPQVGAGDPAQRDAAGQSEDLMHQVNVIGLAAEQERAPGPLDDGNLVPGQETVDNGGVDRPSLPEPVDGELAPGGRPADGVQAASSVVTWPSSAST